MTRCDKAYGLEDAEERGKRASLGKTAVDVDGYTKDSGGVVGDEATDYLYPTGGKTDVAEKDVEQVVVVDGVEGFADVEESGGERRVVFAGLVLLAQEEEEGLLVTIAVVTEARLAEVGLAYIGVSTDEGKEVEVNSFVEEADALPHQLSFRVTLVNVSFPPPFHSFQCY